MLPWTGSALRLLTLTLLLPLSLDANAALVPSSFSFSGHPFSELVSLQQGEWPWAQGEKSHLCSITLRSCGWESTSSTWVLMEGVLDVLCLLPLRLYCIWIIKGKALCFWFWAWHPGRLEACLTALRCPQHLQVLEGFLACLECSILIFLFEVSSCFKMKRLPGFSLLACFSFLAWFVHHQSFVVSIGLVT